MTKEIKFSLVYRDMWQSSGKYQPRVDQLERIAPVIVSMGCFDRIETNGGAFEQVNLMYGENPNRAVRAWTKPFNQAGIQTHMLERALNGLRMYGVPKDVPILTVITLVLRAILRSFEVSDLSSAEERIAEAAFFSAAQTSQPSV